MDITSVYGLIGLAVVEITGLFALWLRMERTRSDNGSAVSRAMTASSTNLATLREEAFTEIGNLKNKLLAIEADRDSWQLRALQCEERERLHA